MSAYDMVLASVRFAHAEAVVGEIEPKGHRDRALRTFWSGLRARCAEPVDGPSVQQLIDAEVEAA